MMNLGENINWMMSGMGATSMLIMMLFHIAVFVGFVYFIVYLVKVFSKEKLNYETSNGLIILEERFAKGEINEDEFKRMNKILNASQ